VRRNVPVANPGGGVNRMGDRAGSHEIVVNTVVTSSDWRRGHDAFNHAEPPRSLELIGLGVPIATDYPRAAETAEVARYLLEQVQIGRRPDFNRREEPDGRNVEASLSNRAYESARKAAAAFSNLQWVGGGGVRE
jgi:hypothetical protein